MCKHTCDPGWQMLLVVWVGCQQPQLYLQRKGLPLYDFEGPPSTAASPRQDSGA